MKRKGLTYGARRSNVRAMARKMAVPSAVDDGTEVEPARVVVVPDLGEPDEADDEPALPDASDELGDILALSDESYREATWYVYRRRDHGAAPRGRSVTNAPVYVAKLVGPLEIEEVRNLVGGGMFKICGYRKRNGRNVKFIERNVEIEGPRKVWDDVPVRPAPNPNATATAAATPGVPRELVEILSRIEQRLANTQQTPAVNGFSVKDMLELLRQLQPAPALPADVTMMKEMVGMAKDFMQLGAERQPDGEGWVSVVDKLTPLAERLLSNVRRPTVPMPPPPAPQPQHGASSAQVENVSPRMTAVVESLARAIDEGLDPSDFAGTVETILNDDECASLKLATAEHVIGELRTLSSRFPIFNTEQAATYVGELLEHLKNPPDDSEN